MKIELVLETISNAKRGWDLDEGCKNHSDLGAQYTAKAMQELLRYQDSNKVFQGLVNQVTMLGVKVFSPFSERKLSTGDTSKYVKKSAKRSPHTLRVLITRVAYKKG